MATVPTVWVFDSQGGRAVFDPNKLSKVITKQLDEGDKDGMVNIPGISVPLARYEARRLRSFLSGDPPFVYCEIVVISPDKAFLHLDGELMH